RASVIVPFGIVSADSFSQPPPSNARGRGAPSGTAVDATVDRRTTAAATPMTKRIAGLLSEPRSKAPLSPGITRIPLADAGSSRSRGRGLHVDLALLPELERHLLHAGGGVVPHLLRELHGAELRPAHRTEMRHLGALGRQRLVVERTRRHRIEREIELIL